MRLVFMGTPEFAVPALEALIHNGHDVIAVYTQPPRPAGRGHKLQPSPVQLCAEKHGIEVKSPVNFKQEADKQALRDLKPDIAVVAAYGLILPQSVLDIPVHGCLNIHGSILPRWRGAAPIHRAILEGDTETGITIMRMEAGLDTGPMLLKGTTPINASDTVKTVHDRLSLMGADLIVEAINNLSFYPQIVQPEDGVTYAHKILKEDGFLRGQETAQKIDRMVRSLNPWPGVWLEKNGVRLKILEGFERIGNSAPGEFGDILGPDLEYGMLCAETEDSLRSIYQITKLQTPNGKQMDVASAINGGLLKCVTN